MPSHPAHQQLQGREQEHTEKRQLNYKSGPLAKSIPVVLSNTLENYQPLQNVEIWNIQLQNIIAKYICFYLYIMPLFRFGVSLRCLVEL